MYGDTTGGSTGGGLAAASLPYTGMSLGYMIAAGATSVFLGIVLSRLARRGLRQGASA